MNSSFIKMLHILISTLGERASERSGGVEERKENFAKTATIPQQQRGAPLLSVALVSRSQKRAWPEVARHLPHCTTQLCSRDGLQSPEANRKWVLSGEQSQRKTGDITLEGARTALKVGREGVRPGDTKAAGGWEGDLQSGMRSAFHICPSSRRQCNREPG